MPRDSGNLRSTIFLPGPRHLQPLYSLSINKFFSPSHLLIFNNEKLTHIFCAIWKKNLTRKNVFSTVKKKFCFFFFFFLKGYKSFCILFWKEREGNFIDVFLRTKRVCEAWKESALLTLAVFSFSFPFVLWYRTHTRILDARPRDDNHDDDHGDDDDDDDVARDIQAGGDGPRQRLPVLVENGGGTDWRCGPC